MGNNVTQEELTEIRERSEKATEGPWRYLDQYGYLAPVTLQSHVANICNEIVRKEDAAFIAHARQDIPKLLAEVERLSKLVEYYAYDASSDGDDGHAARKYIHGGDRE